MRCASFGVEFPDVLKRPIKCARDTEREFEGRRIFARFDGDDRLAGCADKLGERLLGHPALAPEAPDFIVDPAFGRLYASVIHARIASGTV